MTDDQLMALVAKGDEDACHVLVERWERPVFAFLYRMLGSREDAQELGQETFLRMYREANGYQPSGQFKSWLFRIAGNQARSRLRRRRIVKWLRFDLGAHDLPARTIAADDELEREEARAAVRAAISRLPDRQRQMVILRQYNGLSYQQLADVLETTVPAVESALHRAMTALRKDLGRKKAME